MEGVCTEATAACMEVELEVSLERLKDFRIIIVQVIIIETDWSMIESYLAVITPPEVIIIMKH